MGDIASIDRMESNRIRHTVSTFGLPIHPHMVSSCANMYTYIHLNPTHTLLVLFLIVFKIQSTLYHVHTYTDIYDTSAMLTIHMWQVATIEEVIILGTGRSFYCLNNGNKPVI